MTGPAKVRCKTGLGGARKTMLIHRVVRMTATLNDDQLIFAGTWLCGTTSNDAVIVTSAEGHGGMCSRCEDKHHGPVLYRCYGSNGELLYIGSTIATQARYNDHKAHSRWWPLVASIRAERHPTIASARLAESHAIRAEKPIHNKRLRLREAQAAS